MNTRKLGRWAIAAALAVPSLGAQAAPTFQNDTLNSEFFNNFENIYRTNANCETFGGCLGEASGPEGYQLVDQSVVNNLVARDSGGDGNGDVIVGIFNIQNIDAAGNTIWFSAADDQFTGYFAQEIASINNGAGPLGPGDRTDPYSGNTVQFDHLTFDNPTVDPFGILSADEMFRLFVDDGAGVTQFTSNGGGAGTGLAGVIQDIDNATDGDFWASLGAGDVVTEPGVIDTDGFGYGHINLAIFGANASDQEAFFGLNLVALGDAYNKGVLTGINDVNEDEIGGDTALHSPALALIFPCATDPLQPNVACTDFIGTAEIEANPNSNGFFGGNSPWFFRSNDPFENFPITVPEPGSLALLGVTLLGLVAVRRRKS